MVHGYYAIFKKTKINSYVLSFSGIYQAYPVMEKKWDIEQYVYYCLCTHI